MILYKRHTEEELSRKLRYPHDLKIIREYLVDKGKFFTEVDDYKLQDLYEDFCDYYDASWLGVNEFWLDRFCDWLSNRDF